MAKVCVALPVYNAEGFLAETLDSILAQTFTDFELVISDNASTDGSLDLLLRDFGHATILPQELNLGFGTATNLAARNARG